MIKIDLHKNEIVRTDVFQNDNMAETIQIDFTNCDVNDWNKYLEIETAEGKSYRVDLGSELITEYKITNMITRKGELKLNPLALKVDKLTKKVVAQKGFKTFQINVQETVNAYGEGTPNYDDIVLPLIDDMHNLTMIVDGWASLISLLEEKTDENRVFIDELFENITRIDDLIVVLDSKVNNNKQDIDTKISSIQTTLTALNNTLETHKRLIDENKDIFDEYKLSNDEAVSEMQEKITTLNTFMSEQKLTNEEINESIGSLGRDFQEIVRMNVQILQEQIDTLKVDHSEMQEHIEGIDVRLKYVEANGGSGGEGGGIPQELLDDVANLKVNLQKLSDDFDVEKTKISDLDTKVAELQNIEEGSEQRFLALEGEMAEIPKPKDYIIDYGSGTFGNWEKWASGKLVQWGKFPNATMNANVSRELPLPFVGNAIRQTLTLSPEITNSNVDDMYIVVKGFSSTKDALIFKVITESTFSATMSVQFTFIGTWK